MHKISDYNSKNKQTYFFDSSDSDISIVSIGKAKCEAKDVIKTPRMLNYFSLHFVFSGEGIYEYGGTQHLVKQGDCFLIYPFTEIRRYPLEPNYYEIFWIDFMGKNCNSMIKQTDFSETNCIIADMTDLIKNILLNLLAQFQIKKKALEYETLSALYKIFSTLIENKSQTLSSGFKNTKLFKIIDYLEKNYSDESLCLDSVADATNFNASYLSRLFHKQQGQKFSYFLSGLRIQKALELFNTGNYYPQEVYAMVGFKDYVYFSKLFKKYFDVTPSEHCKKVKENLTKLVK